MSSSSSHTNVHYLVTPEKRLIICHLTKHARSAEKEVKRQEKVAMLIKHADELDHNSTMILYKLWKKIPKNSQSVA